MYPAGDEFACDELYVELEICLGTNEEMPEVCAALELAAATCEG